jgi:hypothetical protein
VRFHVREDSGFEETWVRVQRTVIVDDKGAPHYASAESGQMWLPVIVKAYAVFHGGGHYGSIDGGHPADVFRAVLGRDALAERVNVPFPAECARTMSAVAKLSDADAKVLEAFRHSRAWTAEAERLLAEPSRRAEPAALREHLDQLVVAGLSRTGRDAIQREHEARFKLGPLGSGVYSTDARETWETIRTALDAKRPAVLGTAGWGRLGTRENLTLVPGIASQHAYVVRDAFAKDGLLWVRIENPWGRKGRKYERKGTTWIARATTPDEDAKEGGVFDVELSDVVRYVSVLQASR